MIEMTPQKGSAIKSASAERNKEEEMAELRKMIEEKVEKYVPDDQEDPDAEFTGKDMLSTGQILFRFSDWGDLGFFWAGIIASTGFGGALPGFCLFFGEMIDGMGEATVGNDFSPLKT